MGPMGSDDATDGNFEDMSFPGANSWHDVIPQEKISCLTMQLNEIELNTGNPFFNSLPTPKFPNFTDVVSELLIDNWENTVVGEESDVERKLLDGVQLHIRGIC